MLSDFTALVCEFTFQLFGNAFTRHEISCDLSEHPAKGTHYLWSSLNT